MALYDFGVSAMSMMQSPLVGVTTPSCADLASSPHGGIPGLDILSAMDVPVGALSDIGIAGSNTVPFCRVVGQVPYPTGNKVEVEIWMPHAEWYSGRFLAVGNGGFAGTVDTGNMANDVNEGYVVVAGDSGHTAADNNGGQGAPGVYLLFLHNQNQTLAWLHNSIAIMTPPARALVERYYGAKPRHSFYRGCSTGGAQGFALAQYHPDLFDGIVVGCPGYYYSHLSMSLMWNMISENDAGYIPEELLQLILDAVLEECDEIDGVKDGIIENPLECTFDIDSLACPESLKPDTTGCLTPAQIAQAKKMYAGPTDRRSGAQLYPGFSLGSERQLIFQETTLALIFGIPILQNLVFGVSWDFSTFNWASDVDLVEQQASHKIDAISPDLFAFRARGGKMIVTQGWSDPFFAATAPIQHLRDIENFFGGDVSDFFELFMIPGGGHCGPVAEYLQAPAAWHSLSALVDWVETGSPPRQILASDPLDGSDTTRKLCPWPKTAKLVGSDPNDWTSFECR